MTTPFIQVIHQEQVQYGVKGVSQQLKNLTDFLIDKINAPAVKVPNFEEVRQGDVPTIHSRYSLDTMYVVGCVCLNETTLMKEIGRRKGLKR